MVLLDPFVSDSNIGSFSMSLGLSVQIVCLVIVSIVIIISSLRSVYYCKCWCCERLIIIKKCH